jgi:nitrogen-specific signal transduction histidine kinase/CheY-like chemotaxis protein
MREKIDESMLNLNTALEQEKKSKDQRDQLLQNMSHELRTPLHTIQGLSELLKKNKPTPSQVPIISSLNRSVQNLTGLVYDVLDHQKLIDGKLSLNLQPGNIKQLMTEIHQNYQYDALKKGLDFKFKCEKILANQNYLMDPLRLSQIITNLVVNAIKYTDKGSIVLQAAVISDPQQSMLEVTVTDSGAGINQTNLAQINEGIFKEGTIISGRYGSYGLGLSIVKQLVNLLAGRFEATSRPGFGSSFKFVIPLIKAQYDHSSFQEIETVISLPRLDSNKIILQIDDDVSSLELFLYRLNSDQIQLIQFTSYDKMLEQISSIKPDLIITDLMLNEKNYSNELKNAIRNQTISCPVIVVSALELERSKDISVYTFQKPFDAGLLLDQVYSILGSRQYQTPVFSYLYNNYDFKKVKIKRALDLLESEFLSFVDKLQALTFSASLTEWQSISHKLITHLRTLGLTEMQEIIVQTESIPDKTTLQYLIASIQYSLCVIRLEKWASRWTL